jgi:hypothetical protein
VAIVSRKKKRNKKKKQAGLLKDLNAYMHLLLFSPCKPFKEYPFPIHTESGGVFVEAVIERFGEAQRQQLVKTLHDFLTLDMGWYYGVASSFPDMLSALRLSSDATQKMDGIQIAVATGWDDIECELKMVWDRWSTSEETFEEESQILFTMDMPFGKTGATMVRFAAKPCVPLFVMVRLLHLLEHDAWRMMADVGEVRITDRNGLPHPRMNAEAYGLHAHIGLTRFRTND